MFYRRDAPRNALRLVYQNAQVRISEGVSNHRVATGRMSFFTRRESPCCKIEKYGHAELDLGGSLKDFTWKASVSSLEEVQDGLMLEFPHRL